MMRSLFRVWLALAVALFIGVPALAQTRVIPVPSTAADTAIVPVVSTAAESNRVLKAGAGNLYSLVVTTGAIPGFVMIFNATAAPNDGAVTPQLCVSVAATSTISIGSSGEPPTRYTTGITAVFSSTGCFSKTASATAFFAGKVQ